MGGNTRLHIVTVTCAILANVVLAIAGIIDSESSFTNDILEIDGVKYYKRTLAEDLDGVVYDLTVSYKTNNLYYTLYMSDDSLTLYVLESGNKTPRKISNSIQNGQTVTADNVNKKVYLGTSSGLYTYNEGNDEVRKVGIDGYDVWEIVVNKNNGDTYFVDYFTRHAYEFKGNGDLERLDAVDHVENFAIDDKDNIYFLCPMKYLHLQLDGFPAPIKYQGVSNDSLTLLAIDDSNKVYSVFNDILVELKSDNMIPRKVAKLDFTPASLAFNADGDFIFGTNGTILFYSKNRSSINDA